MPDLGEPSQLQEVPAKPSGQVEFARRKVVAVEATINALQAAVVHLFETNSDGIANGAFVDRGHCADLVEPIGLRALDAHFGAAGDLHRWTGRDAF